MKKLFIAASLGLFGLLSISNVEAQTRYIQSRDTLQSGATIYLSSGTISDLNVSTITGSSPIVIDADQIKGNDGSESAPFYSFTSSSDSGIYLGGSENIQIVTGGNAAMAIQSAQQVGFTDGTVNIPSVGFIGDGDLGTFRIAANTYGIAGNGSTMTHFSPTETIFYYSGIVEYQMSATNFRPNVDNANSNGTASFRWSDLRSVLINGADYGFVNGWYIREYPATFKDIQTQDETWFKQNSNKGLQFVNDVGELVMVIGRDGTLYVDRIKTLAELDSNVHSRNIPSQEDKDWEIQKRKEIRGE